MPKLEAILVCVDYTDFQQEVIEFNSKLFDQYIVVTTPEDVRTQELCKKFGATCVISNNLHKNNAIFNKGALINDGVANLKFNEFVIFTDADCLFPSNLRDLIPFKELDKNTLYGGLRRFIWTYNDWILFKEGKKDISEFPAMPGFGVGFLQFIDLRGETAQHYLKNNKLYPESNTANSVDIAFLERFHYNVKDVGKLPIDIVHLGGHGIAHNGRNFSRIEEFKKPFQEQLNLSNNLIYKE